MIASVEENQPQASLAAGIRGGATQGTNPFHTLLHTPVASSENGQNANTLNGYLQGLVGALDADERTLRAEIARDPADAAVLSPVIQKLSVLRSDVSRHLQDLQQCAQGGRHVQQSAGNVLSARHRIMSSVQHLLGTDSASMTQARRQESPQSLPLQEQQLRGVEKLAMATKEDAHAVTAALEDYALALKYAGTDPSKAAFGKELKALVQADLKEQGIKDSAKTEFETLMRQQRISAAIHTLNQNPNATDKVFADLVGAPSALLFDDSAALFTRYGEQTMNGNETILAAIGRDSGRTHALPNRQVMPAAMTLAKSDIAFDKGSNPFDAVIQAKNAGVDVTAAVDTTTAYGIEQKALLTGRMLGGAMGSHVQHLNPLVTMVAETAHSSRHSNREQQLVMAEKILKHSTTARGSFTRIVTLQQEVARKQCDAICKARGSHKKRGDKDSVDEAAYKARFEDGEGHPQTLHGFEYGLTADNLPDRIGAISALNGYSQFDGHYSAAEQALGVSHDTHQHV